MFERGLSVSLLVTSVSPATLAEQIEMPFVMWSLGPKGNCNTLQCYFITNFNSVQPLTCSIVSQMSIVTVTI